MRPGTLRSMFRTPSRRLNADPQRGDPVADPFEVVQRVLVAGRARERIGQALGRQIDQANMHNPAALAAW